MKTDPFLEQTVDNFQRDLSNLIFAGSLVSGQYRLVSIDLATGKISVRSDPDQRPFCDIDLSRKPESAPEAIFEILTHPRLKRRMSPDMMDDLTCVLFFYVISGCPMPEY